ncbi:MAG: metallophosphoesterase [Gammaproteobacteria bacterium]|nr:metallophosphoesterase [Gammaproteobacteria bacterium]
MPESRIGFRTRNWWPAALLALLTVGAILLGALLSSGFIIGSRTDVGWTQPTALDAGHIPGLTTTFVAFGDTGTGDRQQFRVAEGIEGICESSGCDLALGLGDNFYPDGVRARSDPQFQTKFEKPFAALQMPFYMVLGNHDVEQPKSARAQISYASGRWKMPARWYSFRVGPVRFVALDTNRVAASDKDGQLSWIKETLAARSDAVWTIVFGHHPLYSNGGHGDARGAGRDWLHEAICDSGAVDLYLAGHDHALQWLAPKPASCRHTEFIVSGAGARPRALADRNHSEHFARGHTSGFFWFQAMGESLTGHVYDADGTLLFARTLLKTDRLTH